MNITCPCPHSIDRSERTIGDQPIRPPLFHPGARHEGSDQQAALRDQRGQVTATMATRAAALLSVAALAAAVPTPGAQSDSSAPTATPFAASQTTLAPLRLGPSTERRSIGTSIQPLLCFATQHDRQFLCL